MINEIYEKIKYKYKSSSYETNMLVKGSYILLKITSQKKLTKKSKNEFCIKKNCIFAFFLKICGSSSVGRAQPCQGWGREFESRFPLKLCS